MIESIRRIESTVFLEINPVIFFNFNAGTEMEAELLIKHLYELRQEAKKRIARDCLLYLGREEKSKLKAKLVKEWDGRKHCRKGGN